MLVLSYFKGHYKKYDFNEILELLGITLFDLNDMINQLLEGDMLFRYDGFLVLSKKGEEILRENRMPKVGRDIKKKFRETKKMTDVNEVYIPKNFKL